MFVTLLERLSPDEAQILIAVKDQKLSYKGLTYKLVKDTWPDLLPEQEEKDHLQTKMINLKYLNITQNCYQNHKSSNKICRETTLTCYIYK